LLEEYDLLQQAGPEEVQRLARAAHLQPRVPSRLTVALLARQRATNARLIELSLARTREERRLAERWGRYGSWLAGHPAAVQELERRLGFRIIG